MILLDKIKGAAGAGDAFCAGVLYSLHKSYPVREILAIANAAGMSLLEVDPVSGVRNIRELKAFYQKHKGSALYAK